MSTIRYRASMSPGIPSPRTELMRQVASRFADDPYLRLRSVYQAALAQLPGPVPASAVQQFRTWSPAYGEAHRAELGIEGPISKESLHYLGLVKDVAWSTWPEAYREQVASYLESKGLAVERTAEGKLLRRHLHFGIPRPEAIRAGVIPLLRSVVAGLERAGR